MGALVSLGIWTLVAPKKIREYRKKSRAFYWGLILSAAAVQFPILLGGYWDLGIAFSEIQRNFVFDASILMVPLLYIGVFVLSILTQRRGMHEDEEASFILASYASAVVSPFVYFSTMMVVYFLLN